MEDDYEAQADTELTREYLTGNSQWLTDVNAAEFNRTGEDITDPDELWESWTETGRDKRTNTLSVIREWDRVSGIEDEEEFSRSARLRETYDRMPNESGNPFTIDDTGRRVWGDYIESAITDPFNWGALYSGGASKIAGLAAGQAAKTGTKALLQKAGQQLSGGVVTNDLKKEAVKGAVRTAAVEAPLGAAINAGTQVTDKELGIKDEVNLGQVATAGAISGTIGSVLGAGFRVLRANRGDKAGKYLEVDTAATAEAVANGQSAAKAAKNKWKKDWGQEYKDLKSTYKNLTSDELMPLDVIDVAAGRKVLNDAAPTDAPLAPTVDTEMIERVTAAAFEVQNLLDPKKGERISATIYRAIVDGKLFDKSDDLVELQAKYGLSEDQFGLMYLATRSEAGTVLGSGSQLRPAIAKSRKETLQTLGKAKIVPPNEMDEVIKQGSWWKRIAGPLDKLRRSGMTSQIATTMRNTAGGGIRGVVHTFDNALTEIFRAAMGKSTGAAVKASFRLLPDMFDTHMSQAVKELAGRHQSTLQKNLFRAFSDVSAQKEGKYSGAIMSAARALNTFNTMSDNFIKQGVFMNGVRRRLAADGVDLTTVLKDGNFNKISADVLSEAADEAIYFAYQSTPQGKNLFSKVAKGAIDLDNNAPFTLSLLIPFPRFLANSLQFVYEHAPGAGLIGIKAAGRDGARAVANQITGMTFIAGVAAYSLKTGDGGLDTFEFTGVDRSVQETKAIAGPFAPMILVGKTIARYIEGQSEDGKYSLRTDPDGLRKRWADAVESLFGFSTRSAMGFKWAYDLAKDAGDDSISSGAWEAKMGKAVGDFFATYMIPLNMFKDMSMEVNPEERKFTETRSDNPKDMAKNRAGRSIPTFSKGLPEKQSVTRADAPKRVNPVLDWMGTRTVDPRNTVETEFTRLEIPGWKLKSRTGSHERDYLADELMGAIVEKEIGDLILSKEYQTIQDTPLRGALGDSKLDQTTAHIDGVKRNELEIRVRDIQNLVSKYAAGVYGKGFIEYGRLPPAIQKSAVDFYDDTHAITFSEEVDGGKYRKSKAWDIVAGYGKAIKGGLLKYGR